MKLKELLMLLYDAGQFDKHGIMNSDSLKRVKHHIMTCDEFKDVKELIFVKTPIWKDPINNKTIQSKKYKLVDDLKFGHTVYLQSILITPEMYDPDHWENNDLKGGAAITPIMFEPKCRIVIEHILPTIGGGVNFTDTDKLNILEKFKRVLDTPEDYIVKGHRDLIIRGLIN